MTSSVEPLEHEITGNSSAKTLLIFLQGWPDSMEMWENYIQPGKNLSEFRILTMNFPNSGKEKISWGQDFDTISERIKKTVDLVEGVNKRILVCHDWGCVYGYLTDQKYPKFFSQIVAMDVPAYVEVSSFKAKMMVFAYQTTLITAFLIGGFIGRFLTQAVARFFKYCPAYFDKIDGSRNYAYFYFIKNAILSKIGATKKYLQNYKPSVPVAYLYGTRKPYHFHGQKWLQYLRDREGCQIHPISSGHWFMIDFKDFVLDVIRRRAKI